MEESHPLDSPCCDYAHKPLWSTFAHSNNPILLNIYACMHAPCSRFYVNNFFLHACTAASLCILLSGNKGSNRGRTYTFRRQEILEHPTTTADLITIYPPLMDPEEVRHAYMYVHNLCICIAHTHTHTPHRTLHKITTTSEKACSAWLSNTSY